MLTNTTAAHDTVRSDEYETEQRQDGRNRSGITHATPLSISKLAVIPIPIFSRRRWEWENSRALFKANLHDQDDGTSKVQLSCVITQWRS